MIEKLKKTIVFFSRYIFGHFKNTIKVLGSLSLSLITSGLNALPILVARYLNSRGKEVSSEVTQKIFLGLGASFLLSELVAKLRNAVVMPVSTEVQNTLSVEILRKCFNFSLQDYLSTRTGEFTRIQSSNQFVVSSIIPTVFGEVIPIGMDTLVITIALYYLYGPILGAVPVAILFSHTVVSLCFLNPSNKAKLESRDKAFKGIGKLVEALMAYLPAHQFDRVDYEMDQVLPLMDESEHQRLKAFQIDNLTSALQTIFNYAGLGFSFFYSGRLYSQQLITGNDFAAIAYLMFLLSSKFKALSPSLVTLQAAYLEFQKIIDFFDRPSQEHPDSYPLELNAVPNIAFEHVDFTYQTSEQSLKLSNITFEIAAGGTLAIVGQSGSGKSTLIQLLMRFYEIEEGAIKINGKNINEMTLKSLRDCIVVVPQEPHLFFGTVRENIRYGRLDATDEEIEAVAKWAGLWDEVDLDSDVGVGGKKLSGGQRQRIGIARGYLKGAPILCLDEATTALDPEKEVEVQNNLGQMKAGVTTLIVTHKLYTLKTGINQILYMEKGEIIESGTFAELLYKQGRFYDQYVTQCKELGIPFDKNFNQLPESIEENKKNDNLPYYSMQQAFFNRKFKQHKEFPMLDISDKSPLLLNEV